jgi:hypothetical protein
LKLRDTLPELFSLRRLRYRMLDQALHGADASTTETGATIVQHRHRDLESFAYLA